MAQPAQSTSKDTLGSEGVLPEVRPIEKAEAVRGDLCGPLCERIAQRLIPEAQAYRSKNLHLLDVKFAAALLVDGFFYRGHQYVGGEKRIDLKTIRRNLHDAYPEAEFPHIDLHLSFLRSVGLLRSKDGESYSLYHKPARVEDVNVRNILADVLSVYDQLSELDWREEIPKASPVVATPPAPSAEEVERQRIEREQAEKRSEDRRERASQKYFDRISKHAEHIVTRINTLAAHGEELFEQYRLEDIFHHLFPGYDSLLPETFPELFRQQMELLDRHTPAGEEALSKRYKDFATSDECWNSVDRKNYRQFVSDWNAVMERNFKQHFPTSLRARSAEVRDAIGPIASLAGSIQSGMIRDHLPEGFDRILKDVNAELLSHLRDPLARISKKRDGDAAWAVGDIARSVKSDIRGWTQLVCTLCEIVAKTARDGLTRAEAVSCTEDLFRTHLQANIDAIQKGFTAFIKSTPKISRLSKEALEILEERKAASEEKRAPKFTQDDMRDIREKINSLIDPIAKEFFQIVRNLEYGERFGLYPSSFVGPMVKKLNDLLEVFDTNGPVGKETVLLFLRDKAEEEFGPKGGFALRVPPLISEIREMSQTLKRDIHAQ